MMMMMMMTTTLAAVGGGGGREGRRRRRRQRRRPCRPPQEARHQRRRRCLWGRRRELCPPGDGDCDCDCDSASVVEAGGQADGVAAVGHHALGGRQGLGLVGPSHGVGELEAVQGHAPRHGDDVVRRDVELPVRPAGGALALVRRRAGPGHLLAGPDEGHGAVPPVAVKHARRARHARRRVVVVRRQRRRTSHGGKHRRRRRKEVVAAV
mmetsp:Transcript_26354/g.85284  ORF Transcript_26354/g.85284 Transcript_26354/m.85284 type:complete len:209 (+) Transcript_26354:656-1282(+)